MRCLHADPLSTLAWHNLALTLTTVETVIVRDKEFSKKDLYIEAIRINPQNAQSWHNLAMIILNRDVVEIDGVKFTRKQLLEEHVARR